MEESFPRELSTRPNVSVAGRHPRPLGTGVLYQRLKFVSDSEQREYLAHQLAEACFECFDVERIFRELIERHPDDVENIMTALVSLEIAFKGISWHLAQLRKPLSKAVRLADASLEGKGNLNSEGRRARRKGVPLRRTRRSGRGKS